MCFPDTLNGFNLYPCNAVQSPARTTRESLPWSPESQYVVPSSSGSLPHASEGVRHWVLPSKYTPATPIFELRFFHQSKVYYHYQSFTLVPCSFTNQRVKVIGLYHYQPMMGIGKNCCPLPRALSDVQECAQLLCGPHMPTLLLQSLLNGCNLGQRVGVLNLTPYDSDLEVVCMKWALQDPSRTFQVLSLSTDLTVVDHCKKICGMMLFEVGCNVGAGVHVCASTLLHRLIQIKSYMNLNQNLKSNSVTRSKWVDCN